MDITRVARIKVLYKQNDAIRESIAESEQPILKDWGLIPDMHRYFVEYMTSIGASPVDFTKRRQFVFVVLYLFAPRTLAGCKMPVGLRDRICSVLNLHARSSLSNQIRDLLFYYSEYRDFRRDTDDLYAYISDRIGIESEINQGNNEDVKDCK